MNLFIGYLKHKTHPLGEWILADAGDLAHIGPPTILLKNIVRVIEVQDPQSGKTGHNYFTDGFFTNDEVSKVEVSDFLITKIATKEEEYAIKSYENFMMQLRASRSGLKLETGMKTPKSFEEVMNAKK